MVWIGRLISIPVGVVFFTLLLVTLVLLQVAGTFLSPDYYTDELRKADVYEFALVDLLTTALDERREFEIELRESESGDENRGIFKTPLVASGLTTGEIVSAVNRAVPPEWVQGIVEQSFDQFGRYLTGERDEFAVTIRAGVQVAIVVDEVKSLLRKADAYNLLFDEVAVPTIEEVADKELPLGVDLDSDQLVESARVIVTPDWMQTQVESAVNEVTPYLVGERDDFEINVRLADRAEIALGEVKKILRQTDAYELLYAEVVDPLVRGRIGGSTELPFGVTISDEEVLSSLRRVAPVDWVQEQVETLIDDAGPYLTRRQDGFATTVSLVENKRAARDVIDGLVQQRLQDIIDGLRECESLQEACEALSGASGGLPSCVPPNLPVQEVIERFDIDIAGGIERFVLD